MSRTFHTYLGVNSKPDYKTEILSGLTVSLALVPEAIAFSMIAGLSPLTGLYASIVVGLVIALFGGRPGMISGATSAVAVLLVGLTTAVREQIPNVTSSEMLSYVFATLILAGIFQVIVGSLRLGKFIRLVPQPVLFGFVNGLAIVIFMAQIPTITSTTGVDADYTQLSTKLALVLLTMLIIWMLPRFTKAVPASLVAVIFVSLLVIGFGIDTTTVGDRLAPGESIQGGLPPFSFPHLALTWDNFMLILPYASIVAGVGLIESLLLLNIVDEITETRGVGNRECVALGFANIASGCFSGMGGCAMIGQTLINIGSGARTRISNFVAASMLLIFVLFCSEVIEMLPMAALAGLMIMVAINTFEWASLRTFKKMPGSDVFVMVAVTLIIAVTRNLVIAVVAGVLFSAVAYAWENAKLIKVTSSTDMQGVKHYHVVGPLFFASIKLFAEQFDPQGDPQSIIIDFSESRITDMSAISALDTLTKRYRKYNKQVTLQHLSEDCRNLLGNANAIIDVNVQEDPTYRIPYNQEALKH